MKKVKLKPNREISVLRRHLWIFSGGIQSSVNGLNDGDIVEVYSSEGKFLCTGYYMNADIAVRILSFDRKEIDTEFFLERFKLSFLCRKATLKLNLENQMYRLIHGEGDGIPGLIIDIYGDIAVVQTHNAGIDLQLPLIKAALGRLFQSEGMAKEIIVRQANRKGEVDVESGRGEAPAARFVAENGYRFFIDWNSGQKTGFFIDQRENRKLIESLASGRVVLDAFCYSGGFSVYALGGGAKEVVSVDASRPAVELVNKNVAENFTGNVTHEAKAVDFFNYLENPGKEFDLIILDPPAFAKHRNAIQSALRGYEMINSQAMKIIKTGGLIATFSCSQLITKQLFFEMLGKAARRSGREVKLIRELGQAVCHPVNPCHVEGEYLKGWLMWVG